MAGGEEQPQTWHHGIVARWWAEFNVDGPEIPYFQKFIADEGQPALDLACGTGRLLIPYLRAGLDVDGCDVSPDMLALCRERAEAEGLSPKLFAQAMHELELPRRYRTVVVCGGFGLGANRAQGFESLRRIYEHLEPGGVLLLDNDPLAQSVTIEMRADMWRNGVHEGEEHVLRMSLYFTPELVSLLERAGFDDIMLRGDYTDEEPNADTDFVVFIARKAA
ncbi:MAG: class I SAM-dependent methyltransferase [Actinobacteria bacterium]|nr:MAG: class I SAM-dependent methyltransferase [Actinomycetota bacterium]